MDWLDLLAVQGTLKSVLQDLRVGSGGNGDQLLKKYVLAFEGDKNILNLDYDDGCTIL